MGWAGKVPKLFWRGSMKVGTADRESMKQMADGHSWNDVQEVVWSGESNYPGLHEERRTSSYLLSTLVLQKVQPTQSQWRTTVVGSSTDFPRAIPIQDDCAICRTAASSLSPIHPGGSNIGLTFTMLTGIRQTRTLCMWIHRNQKTLRFRSTGKMGHSSMTTPGPTCQRRWTGYWRMMQERN